MKGFGRYTLEVLIDWHALLNRKPSARPVVPCQPDSTGGWTVMPKSTLRIALAAGTLLPIYSQTIEFVPGSTLPLVQLTGEHFQIQSGSRFFSELTAAQTLSRYGALGTDL